MATRDSCRLTWEMPVLTGATILRDADLILTVPGAYLSGTTPWAQLQILPIPTLKFSTLENWFVQETQ